MDKEFLGSTKGLSLGSFIAWGMHLLLIVMVLYPVFSASRDRDARLCTCQSNLKQLGLASFMYTQDWDGRWMPARARTGPIISSAAGT